jgi:heat shock protein HslJ
MVATVGAAGPQQIEGFYRYGHEVNTVCTGQPEFCYWLVDTADNLRRQLKQEVAGLAPYTAVCLRLEAELSPQKADGFGRDYDGSIRVLEILGRCDDAAGVKPIGIEDLHHRRWILQSIDGVALANFARELGFEEDSTQAKQPDHDFGEQGFLSGNTGCNQFHGQAKVVDGNLILAQLATTAMLCEGFAGELELQLQLLYRTPLAITFDGNHLVLVAAERELRYAPRDWVQ